MFSDQEIDIHAYNHVSSSREIIQGRNSTPLKVKERWQDINRQTKVKVAFKMVQNE